MLAAILLSFIVQAEAPAQADEASPLPRLEFQTSAALEYWMLTRTVLAGQAPPLDLDGMREAVAIGQELLESEDSALALMFGDMVFAQVQSMEEGVAVLQRDDVLPPISKTWQRDLSLVVEMAEALATTEASFRSIHWLPRQERLERIGAEIRDAVGEREEALFDFLMAGIGREELDRTISYRLVTTMPSPGGMTVRVQAGPICMISLADQEGDLRDLSTLVEVAVHESMHAVESAGMTDDSIQLSGQLMKYWDQENEREVERNWRMIREVPHAWTFAHADAAMRHVLGHEGPTYAERQGIYQRMGKTARFAAQRWTREVDQQLAAGEPLAANWEAYVEEVMAFAQRERRPNILLILADDQGWADFSHLGLKDDVATPRLDQLAAEGVSLPQAYASSPICNPSRVGLITGRYQQRWNNYYYGGGRGLPDESITLAERLKAADYRTGYFGKVHTGGPDNAPDKAGFPLNHGFDRFFGTTCGGRVHYLYHSRAAQQRYGKAAGQMEVEPMWDQDRQIEWEGFTTVDWTQQAIDFIEEDLDQPWFVFLNHNAVHNFAWQLPEEELEARGLEFFPDWNADEIAYREWYKGVHRRDWPEGRAYYLAQLEILDREVGRLLDELDRLGESENTLVIYTVDNGGCVPDWADNGPLAGSKYHLMEGGTRVRTFLKMPEVLPAGRVHDGVFSSLDLAPTICELIDLPTERGAFDGVSQLAQLQGDAPADPNRTLFWDTGWQRSVRMGDWKLLVTVNEQRARGSANFEQVDVRFGTHLYHLGEDPGETNNLAEQRPDLVRMLTERHRSWRASIGQPLQD